MVCKAQRKGIMAVDAIETCCLYSFAMTMQPSPREDVGVQDLQLAS